jgi:hypothetical protein
MGRSEQDPQGKGRTDPAPRAPMPKTEADSFGLSLATIQLVVVSGFVLYYSVPGNIERQLARTDRVPMWLLGPFLVLLPIALGLIAGWFNRVAGVAVGSVFVPSAAVMFVHRLVEPDPTWIDVLRGASVVYTLCVVFLFVVVFGRRHVELDRVLFTEATSIAFFATLLIAGGYAALEAHADLPRLSFAWIPVVGLCIWGACALVFKRGLS